MTINEVRIGLQPYLFTAVFGVGIASFVEANSEDSAKIALSLVILPQVTVRALDVPEGTATNFEGPSVNSNSFCVVSSDPATPLNLHVQGYQGDSYHLNQVSLANQGTVPMSEISGTGCEQGNAVTLTRAQTTYSAEPTVVTVMPE